MQDNLELLHDRYTKALFECAMEDGSLERVGEELGALSAEWLKDKVFDRFLTHPLISTDEKKAVIEDLARRKKFCWVILDFLKVLIDNRRETLIHAVLLRYKDLYDRFKKQARVYVETPRPLKKDEKTFLEDTLMKKFGKKINLETIENPALIGGMSVQHKDRIYDYSLKRQLASLGGILAKRKRG